MNQMLYFREDEVDTTCPECNGNGIFYYAYSIRDIKVLVSGMTYNILPKTKAKALAKGQNYYQGYIHTCPACKGTGEIH